MHYLLLRTGRAVSQLAVRALPRSRTVRLGSRWETRCARALRTEDYGLTWSVTDVPVVAGVGAGLTSVHVGADGVGIALGGEIGRDLLATGSVALTSDAGLTWTAGGALALDGPVYGSALLPGGAAVAVGPGGLDWSADGGQSWQASVTLEHWAVAFSSHGSGWAVGPEGRITKLGFLGR